MLGAGKAGVFFGLILPHGHARTDRGVHRRRGRAAHRLGLDRARAPVRGPQALAEAGRATAVVALGLVGVLAVSGAIEAFVTPSGLPTAARIGIGVVAEVAFLTYVVRPRPPRRAGRRDRRPGASTSAKSRRCRSPEPASPARAARPP